MKNLMSLFVVIFTLTFSLVVGAQSNAGKVIFTSGINKVIDSNGNERVAKRGELVNSGDRIQTSSGRMQVRFNDNGFVSIKPRSELLIEDYRFSGEEDGTENAIFNLLKGSVRAVTGLIGNRNKQAYQYKTPVATIGIRGTAFVINYCNGDCFDDAGNPVADGLYVNNGEGKVILTSNGGTIDLIRGQFAYVEDEDSIPMQLREAPSITEQIEIIEDFLEDVDIDDLQESQIQQSIVNLDNTQYRSGLAVATTDLSDIDGLVNVDVWGTEYNEKIRPLNTGGSSGPISNVQGDTVVLLQENAQGQNRMTGFGQVYTFVQNNNLRTYVDIFETSDNATGRFGGDDDYGVIWGTWETGWRNEVQFFNSDGSLDTEESGVSTAAEDYLFHYILSNELTPIADNGLYQIGDQIIQYGSKTDPVTGGQVAYFNTDMNSGQDAIYGQQSVFVEVDFGTAFMNEFEISGFFGAESADRNYSASLSAPVDFYEDSTFSFDSFDCSANLCGNTSQSNSNGAVATIDFLGQDADAAMGSYAMQFFELNGPTHIIGGTYLIEETSSSSSNDSGGGGNTVITPTGISGLNYSSVGDISATSIISQGGFNFNNTNAFSISSNNTTGQLNSFVANQGGGNGANFNSALNSSATTATPTLGGENFDTQFNVGWGYWSPNVSDDYDLIVNGANPHDFGVDGVLHYIYSNNITDANNLPTTGSLTFNNLVGGNITFTNINTNILNPAVGTINDVSIDYNFSNSQISQFDLIATFQSPGDFSMSNSNMTGTPFDTNGPGSAVIESVTCNFCNTGTLSGQLDYQFVGENNEAMMSSFSVDNAFDGDVVSGTFLVSQ